MICRPKILVGLLLLLHFASPCAPSQYPVGYGTSVAGAIPLLTSEPLWLGNAAFGYRISGAPPGGSGVLGVSTRAGSSIASGLQLWISLASTDLFSLETFVADATGGAIIPRPLGGISIPALTGFQLHAQAAVMDPLTSFLGASQALLLEVSLPPLMFVQIDGVGSRLLDPYTGQVILPSPDVTVPGEATFGNGGRDLFLATVNGLFHLDATATAPGFTMLLPGTFLSVARELPRSRLILLQSSPVGATVVVDGVTSSSTFGQIIATLPWAAAVAVSADGTRLARMLGWNLELLDFDPASATYLQILISIPIAQPSTYVTHSLHLSPDGRTASLTRREVLTSATTVHRADLAAGLWIDHNPTLPGIQPLGVQSTPPLPSAFTLLRTRDGMSAFVTTGAIAANRLDFIPSNPSAFALAPTMITPAPPPTWMASRYLNVSTGGQFLVEYQYQAVSTSGGAFLPGNLTLVHAPSGGRFPFGTLPPSFNAVATAWR